MFRDTDEFRKCAPRRPEMVIFGAKAEDDQEAETYRLLLLDIARALDPDASVTWHVYESSADSQSESGAD